MFDDGAKKILRLEFKSPQVTPRVFKGKKPGFPRGYTPSQNLLKVLRAGAVPEGKVLNPFGKLGNTFRARYRATWFKRTLKPAWREAAMKRTRLRLQTKKAIALEAHELQQLARENATAAMKTLIEISKNKRAPEATRIAASSVILDRGYGKASQTSITASVTNGKASDIDSSELDTRIGKALKRVEELTNRAPKAGTGEKRSAHLRKLN